MLGAGPALAELAGADYAEVAAELGGSFGFEGFDTRPEPGLQIDGLILAPALTIGERFAGQEVTRPAPDSPFDRVRPLHPVSLDVAPGAPGENHAIAYHAGFGSNALFPVGPDGFSRMEGRGEGSTAIRLLRPSPAAGFLVHADYADPLGSRPPPGQLLVVAYGPDGATLGQLTVRLGHGIQPVAFRSPGGLIGGFLVLPADPGGIAIDDILYLSPDLTGQGPSEGFSAPANYG